MPFEPSVGLSDEIRSASTSNMSSGDFSPCVEGLTVKRFVTKLGSRASHFLAGSDEQTT